MKTFLKKIALFALVANLVIGCSSSADPITPTVVAAVSNHLFIRTQNVPINSCNVWDLVEAFGTAPAGLKRTDTFLPASLGQQIQFSQCSAYCRDMIQGAKRYVVSTGERVLVYDVSLSATSPPIQFPLANVQAMVFVNGNLYMVIGHVLKKYDVFTMMPITSFTPISLLPTAGVSNMTFNGNFLYIIASASLYKIDTTGSGSIVSGYPKALSSADFQGLEYVNNPNPSSPCYNSLYVIRKTTTARQLVRIDEATGIETAITTLTYIDGGPKIASILDYSTEFYYIYSSDGWALNTFTFTTIDLTPNTGAVTPNYAPSLVGYQFGYQLKD